MSLTMIIAAVAAVLAIVVGLTAGIVKAFKIEKDWIKQVIAWVLSIACAFGAYFMGMLEGVPEPTWWIWCLVIGVLTGLAANGLYDITKWAPKKV